jgi:ComF family protein
VLKRLLDGFIDLVYPPHCLLCKTRITPKPDHPFKVLCGQCLTDIRPNVPPFCPVCSRSLGERPDQPRCETCRRHPPSFDFAWSACLFVDPLRGLIHRFKFGDKTSLRHVFVPLMADFIRTYHLDIAQFDCLVPVPLSPVRLRERTYNQAALLAAGLSKVFGVPLSENILERRHSPPQSSLPAKERFTNIQGAFKMKTSSVEKMNILLIDDLLTTGATVSEAAKVLKDNGAAVVGVFTLAITP